MLKELLENLHTLANRIFEDVGDCAKAAKVQISSSLKQRIHSKTHLIRILRTQWLEKHVNGLLHCLLLPCYLFWRGSFHRGVLMKVPPTHASVPRSIATLWPASRSGGQSMLQASHHSADVMTGWRCRHTAPLTVIATSRKVACRFSISASLLIIVLFRQHGMTCVFTEGTKCRGIVALGTSLFTGWNWIGYFYAFYADSNWDDQPKFANSFEN